MAKRDPQSVRHHGMFTTAASASVSIGDQRHRDFLDLSVSAQRHRFASCAALRLGISTAQIMDALGALLPAMKEFTPSPACDWRTWIWSAVNWAWHTRKDALDACCPSQRGVLGFCTGTSAMRERW